MDKLTDVVAREEECEREWRWLIEALHAVAATRSGDGEATAFRMMQQQVIAVGQRRVELMMKRAALETWRGMKTISQQGTARAMEGMSEQT